MSTWTKDGTFRYTLSLLSLLKETLYFEVYPVLDLFGIAGHNHIKENLIVGNRLN